MTAKMEQLVEVIKPVEIQDLEKQSSDWMAEKREE